MSKQATWLSVFLEKIAGDALVWVGFSGGVDSTVLLHALSQAPALAGRLRAIHIHHGLSPHADAWQAHCEKQCEAWQVPLVVKRVNCLSGSNQEAVARRARFKAFDALIGKGDMLVLAHHADDQAETVLLQLCRGAGVSGLSAMQPVRTHHHYTMVRPLLSQNKAGVLAYAKRHQLVWVDDESNASTHHARNALRHDVLPRLKQRWPQVVRRLTVVATHCQQAADNLVDLAELDYPGVMTPLPVLALPNLDRLVPARQMNVLWHWLKAHQVAPLHQGMVLRLFTELCGKSALNGGRVAFVTHEVRRHQAQLYMVLRSRSNRMVNATQSMPWSDFPAPLQLPLGKLTTTPSEHGIKIEPSHSIDVGFRQGGETLRVNGQTKALKKLLQAWGIPAWRRAEIPLVYVNGVLAVVPGYVVHDDYQVQAGAVGMHFQWEPINVD